MSYFIASIGGDRSFINTGRRILEELTDADRYEKTRVIQGADTSLANVPAKKTIPDILWTDQQSNSWLLATGVPVLTNGSGDETIQRFAETLFCDPVTTLNRGIDGHFALIGFDSRKRKMYAATDINSFIPIYYVARSDGTYFSSSELVLANYFRPPLSSFGVAQSLFLGATYGSETRFQGIKKLQGAELLVAELDGPMQLTTYWFPQKEGRWNVSFNRAVDKWLAVLRKAVALFPEASGEAEISSDLTAGEDSRLIVSLCHDLNLPVKTRVMGFKGDEDVLLATKIASEIGLPISVVDIRPMKTQALHKNAMNISRRSDGYGSIFSLAVEPADERESIEAEFRIVNLCGTPGGNVYRGAYYLRAKVLFPSRQRRVDYKLLLKLKFLFDYDAELLMDTRFLSRFYNDIESKLKEVNDFPAGTKVDHIVRFLHVCTFGVNIKRPFYLPFGLRDMTRSIYQIPPHMKQGSKLTRAITERLFPELARLPTKSAVPTLRLTPRRLPLFIPGYISQVRSIFSGVLRRIFRSQKALQKHVTVDLQHHSLEYHREAINMFLQQEPYATWFSSPDKMHISKICDHDRLKHYFDTARSLSLTRVQFFGKLINLELACRWVYKDTQREVN